MKTTRKPDLCDQVAAAISDIVKVVHIIRPGDKLPPEFMRKRKPRRLTPKQKVLRRWPKAVCWQSGFVKSFWFVGYDCPPGTRILGHVSNGCPRQAWADAAMRTEPIASKR